MAKTVSSRTKRNPVKRVSPPDATRSAKSATAEEAKFLRVPKAKPQQKSSNPTFDPRSFLAKAGLGRRLISLRKGRTAYAQGEPADHVFYVQAGRLQVTIVSAAGKIATIALVGPGEFLGEECLVSVHPFRLATATAMTDCALLSIKKTEMVRILHQQPKLSDVFMKFLLARNARIQADLVDQLFNSSEKRLARILLLLAQFGKSSKPETLIPKISQETLAEMIGTTRSRVSFFMNRFRDMGFIEYNGGIQVHNSLLNIFLQE